MPDSAQHGGRYPGRTRQRRYSAKIDKATTPPATNSADAVQIPSMVRFVIIRPYRP